MTNEQVATNIRTDLFPLWAAEYPAIKILQDNENYDPTYKEYIRVSFANAETQNASLGNAYTRTVGLVQIQIFTKINTGDNLSREIGDFLTETFRVMTISGITFRAATLRRVGPDGKWYQMNFDVPYWSEHNA